MYVVKTAIIDEAAQKAASAEGMYFTVIMMSRMLLPTSSYVAMSLH